MLHTILTSEESASNRGANREKSGSASLESHASQPFHAERIGGKAQNLKAHNPQHATYIHTWEHCEGAD